MDDNDQSNDGGGPASQGVEGGEGVEVSQPESQGTSRPSLIQGSGSDGYDDIDGDDVASKLRESCSKTEQQEVWVFWPWGYGAEAMGCGAMGYR